MTALNTMNLARQHGITASCLHPLLFLLDDSPLNPTQIAAMMHCNPANVTGLITRLEKDGWIIRLNCNEDRRMVRLMPSEKAYEIFTPAIEE